MTSYLVVNSFLLPLFILAKLHPTKFHSRFFFVLFCVFLLGEECYTVECSYDPWSAWSASCGKATRRRYQLIEEIELELPSCDHLPLECEEEYVQEETRNKPLCK